MIITAIVIIFGMINLIGMYLFRFVDGPWKFGVYAIIIFVGCIIISLTNPWLSFIAVGLTFNMIIYAAWDAISEKERWKEKSEVFEDELNKNLINITQANRTVETLMYSMAHDLKSPVRSAAGMLAALKEDFLDEDLSVEDGVEMIKLMEKSLRRGMRTVDDVLDYAKAGQNLEVSNCNMDRELEDIVDGFSDREGAIFTLKPLGEFAVDAGAFKKVFHNLIENALKYNVKSKKIVKLYRIEDTIYVEDNGNGIEEKYFHKILKPFQRLDSNTKGTGLGLGIVNKIIELHGYKLVVESTVGEGSKFKIILN
jgi:signal transduction histidine kinase